MRMRKLPWAEEYLQDAEVVIKDPSQLKGRWRTLVHGEKLHLEIGCGKGDYWNQMAKRYPRDGWIAIEKNVSVAGIAVRICVLSGAMHSRWRSGLTEERSMSSISTSPIRGQKNAHIRSV